MAKICIINGSPRKNFNTHKMCEAFERGVKSSNKSVETKIFNLYDYNYKGCHSCLCCKLKDSKSYGHCVIKDDITDVIEEVSNSDGVVFASPIYFMDITGEMKSFLERLLFPYLTYEKGFHAIPPKKLYTATIYTMNVREEAFHTTHFESIEWYISHVFGRPERICAFNTCQVKDYSMYKMDVFNEQDKLLYKDKNWNKDLEKAYTAGRNMAEKITK